MPDLLQPGNVPWHVSGAGGDNPQTFPEFFANETWPAVFQRLVFTYPNAAARDADLAGLNTGDRAFAFLEDSKTLWRWTGSAWALAAPWVQTGTVAVGAIAAGASATFPVTFPVVFPVPNYTVAFELHSTRLGSGTNAAGRTETGFTLVVSNYSPSAAGAGTARWCATLAP